MNAGSTLPQAEAGRPPRARPLRIEEEIFSQAPCISQAPFHVPIRGGYQGGARLSKMDCSDTTQSSPVVLGTRFKML